MGKSTISMGHWLNSYVAVYQRVDSSRGNLVGLCGGDMEDPWKIQEKSGGDSDVDELVSISLRGVLWLI